MKEIFGTYSPFPAFHPCRPPVADCIEVVLPSLPLSYTSTGNHTTSTLPPSLPPPQPCSPSKERTRAPLPLLLPFPGERSPLLRHCRCRRPRRSPLSPSSRGQWKMRASLARSLARSVSGTEISPRIARRRRWKEARTATQARRTAPSPLPPLLSGLFLLNPASARGEPFGRTDERTEGRDGRGTDRRFQSPLHPNERTSAGFFLPFSTRRCCITPMWRGRSDVRTRRTPQRQISPKRLSCRDRRSSKEAEGRRVKVCLVSGVSRSSRLGHVVN